MSLHEIERPYYHRLMTIDVHTFARLGAQARLAELQQEVNDIHAAFPDLRGAAPTMRRRATPPAKAPRLARTEAVRKATPKPSRSSSGWSAAQRQAVGLRMKKYWAAKRKSAAATQAETPTPAATNATPASSPSKTEASQKRAMSPEARARISAAQKKRWAAHRRRTKKA